MEMVAPKHEGYNERQDWICLKVEKLAFQKKYCCLALDIPIFLHKNCYATMQDAIFTV
jgi:hypothetical protein